MGWSLLLLKNKDRWLKDAEGNPRHRDQIKRNRREEAEAERSRFEAKLNGENPRVRFDWNLSEFSSGRDEKGDLMISRIRFRLPFEVNQKLGYRLVEAFQREFEKIVFHEKEE